MTSQQAQPGPHVPIIVLAAACDGAAWAAEAEQTKHDTLSLYSTTLTVLHSDADRVVVLHLQERALVGRLAQTVEQLAQVNVVLYGRQEDWEDSPPGWPQRPTYGS